MQIIRTSLALLALALLLAACNTSGGPGSNVVVPEGPVIESAGAPVLFSRSGFDGELDELIITGSGFGDEQGLSQLYYAGMPVVDYTISEWTDTRITLRFASVFEIVMPFGMFATDPLDDWDFDREVGPRFEVRTANGSATSDPVWLVDASVDTYASIPGLANVQVELYPVFGYPDPEGLEISLKTTAGDLTDEKLVLDSDWEDRTTLTLDPTSSELHIVSAYLGDQLVAYDSYDCCSFSPTWYLAPEGASSLELAIYDRDNWGQADTSFEVRLFDRRYPFAIETIHLGVFETDEFGVMLIDLPAAIVHDDYEVILMKDGFVLWND